MGRGEGAIVEFGYIMSDNQIFAKGGRPTPTPSTLIYSEIQACSILLTLAPPGPERYAARATP